jgi:LmbE family N-acetylglucosaminyl deacetylase
VSLTVVSVHAHPDDEALLTGGTLARAAAEGHRVVLVVGTDGAAGLTGPTSLPAGMSLAELRAAELRESAKARGIDEVIDLGYGDSGESGRHVGAREPFVSVAVEAAAGRLARILHDRHADVVTGYDRVGGYGHPDHRKVHEVTRRAAELAATPVLLEATVDRRRIRRALIAIRWLPGMPAGFHADMSTRFCAPELLTHRVDVRAYIDAKRAAMAAHLSQTSAADEARTLEFCLRLPRRVFTQVFGYEWYHQPGLGRGARLLDDIFVTLR